jgi:hypothetical protein
MSPRTSRLVFCLLLALALVGLRIIAYDSVILALDTPPNHDMLQGSAFFAPNMHSVRLTGDLAWWNPASFTGYAAYYQAFLSPLAPTPGHIVHIGWSQIVRGLALIGAAIPEYSQYLIVNYLILPYLAILAFILFAAGWLRTRAALALAALVFTLSGIGLWLSAWFYFQETFTFFLLLTATHGVLRRPTARRMLLWTAAALIQLASLNYWTLYNLFFFIIVIGALGWLYPHRFTRLWRRVRRVLTPSAGIALALAALTAAVWLILIGSMVIEQRSAYFRADYTALQALDRVQEMRRFTTELFNNQWERPFESYGWQSHNYQHYARYIGAFALPLLVMFALMAWGRRERWLIAVTGGALIVSLAPPPLLTLWETIPLMNSIIHLFYFYSHYWQIGVMLLACAALDRLLAGGLDHAERRRMAWAALIAAGVAALILIGMFLVSDAYPNNDPDLQSILSAALLTLIVGVLAWRAVTTPSARSLFVAALIGLALTDLTGYFASVNRVDQGFTRYRWGFDPRVPLPESVQTRLASAWTVDPQAGFGADLFSNLPIRSDFWIDNTYMKPNMLRELEGADGEPANTLGTDGQPIRSALTLALTQGDPLVFYPPDALIPEAQADWTNFDPASTLVLFDPAPTVQPSNARAGDFSWSWASWSYNDFAFSVTVPQDGWLLVRQLPDPLWDYALDGQPVEYYRANFVSAALPIQAGTHTLTMTYQPFARRIYWGAAGLLEVALIGLLWAAWRSRKSRFEMANRQTTE